LYDGGKRSKTGNEREREKINRGELIECRIRGMKANFQQKKKVKLNSLELTSDTWVSQISLESYYYFTLQECSRQITRFNNCKLNDKKDKV